MVGVVAHVRNRQDPTVVQQVFQAGEGAPNINGAVIQLHRYDNIGRGCVAFVGSGPLMKGDPWTAAR